MRAELKKTTGYIVDVVTRESLEFQYNPDEITDEKSTDFAAIKVPGMSHPRYQYVSGEPRRISFKVSFFKGPVGEKVSWLRSLLYPQHEKTMLRNPKGTLQFESNDPDFASVNPEGVVTLGTTVGACEIVVYDSAEKESVRYVRVEVVDYGESDIAIT